MAHHHLILILGRGQGILTQELSKKYRKAIYSSDQLKTGYITPFVGDAIINQNASSYTHVHILGTKNSMWDTLFEEIAGDRINYDILEKAEKLAGVITNETTSPEDLEEVSRLYGETHGVKAFSYIIPVSENDDDSMAIFNKIMELKDINEGDSISIDITHGLRYQPLFLLTGFEYFSKLKKVKMGDIFYGALELSSFSVDRKNLPVLHGKTDLSQIPKISRGSGGSNSDAISVAEIQNFKVINKMFEAINAGNLFVKYGKTDLLLQLEPLKKREQLSKKLLEFDYRIQLASLDNIKSKSSELLNAISKEIETATSPIDRLLLDSIKQLPDRINRQKNELFASLFLCGFYINTGMYNNAVLASYDVMLRYTAETYQLDNRKERTSKFIKKLLMEDIKTIPEFEDINLQMVKLREIRNAFAHTSINVKDTIQSVQAIKEAYNTIHSSIVNDLFKNLPYIKINPKSPVKPKPKPKKAEKGDPKIRAVLANYKFENEAVVEAKDTGTKDEQNPENPPTTEES